MSYKLNYNDDRIRFKNKDDVINHLLWLLNEFQPEVLELIYPDGSSYLYGSGNQ